MGYNRIILLLNTLKYLKATQIYYRIYYFIRNKFFKKRYDKILNREVNPLNWDDCLLYPITYLKPNTFKFLNLEYEFKETIEWNFYEFGKLWTFNINYFDFLNQEKIQVSEGLFLIKDYIKKNETLKEGKASYTISLRGMNWIKFLSKHKIVDDEINQMLYNHYQILSNNIEHHLLGNHILENGFSLLFGAYYFKDEMLYKKASIILHEELNEQILQDGGHFELSPMYHKIMLHRILDCINLIKNNSFKKNELVSFLEQKAVSMLGWLETLTYKNGDIPNVNDSTYDIAPLSSQLYFYAKRIGISWKKNELKESGYRKVVKEKYELFVDVGHVGASYQPAHVHSDTFSFELVVNNTPFIVDRGISTYEKNNIRQDERGTVSHNTVQIGSREQTVVWGGFRVAKRAKIVKLLEAKNIISATHDGYKSMGIYHTRKFISDEFSLLIEDKLSKNSNYKQEAHYHFHPNIKEININSNLVTFGNLQVQISFSSKIKNIEKRTYNYCLGFNNVEEAIKLVVTFEKELKTVINL